MFKVGFHGHKNILAMHSTTIEITKDTELTTRGDCIVGVGATHGCRDLPQHIKDRLNDPDKTIRFTLEVEDIEFKIIARGSEQLGLSHESDIVIRTSNFTCPRTIAIGADGAADKIPRNMIKKLRDPQMCGTLRIDI
ncbi:MAG: DUF371 domain-containing protein [Candidatus Nitrosoabyssus spongiisocia]|nr:MAG: DUF371 domain-containing protein [Nitrosopumilaceae archaeon AB1(1)]